jgi:N-acetylmuramoyl-L-alanine amidase
MSITRALVAILKAIAALGERTGGRLNVVVEGGAATGKQSLQVDPPTPGMFVPSFYANGGFVRLEDFAPLVATVWGEARGQPVQGQQAVAHVVLNRAAARTPSGRPQWWGGSIEEVITKPWQFSCWDDTDPNAPGCRDLRDRLLRGPQAALSASEAQAYAAALAVLNGAPDPTGGATHYFNPKAVKRPPKWADGKEPDVIIGAHHFYRGVA